jgi:hypothetical protein
MEVGTAETYKEIIVANHQSLPLGVSHGVTPPPMIEPISQLEASALSMGTDSESVQDPHRTPFEWRPPSLAEGGAWWLDRVAHAKAAAQTFPNPDGVFEECLEALRTHRGNYNADGPDPHHLQLLWWEFPREHWIELREGCCMNFVSQLTHHRSIPTPAWTLSKRQSRPSLLMNSSNLVSFYPI